MEEKALDSRSAWSLGDAGRDKLERLSRALGLDDSLRQRAAELFELMTALWNERQVGQRPPWPSDITDDGTPFEFSVAFEGAEPELRLLVESQIEAISETSSWRAGLVMNERIRLAGAYLGDFERIQRLFAPSANPLGPFSLWHGAALKRERTLFKAYVNPQVHGPAAAPALVEQGLRRLGRVDIWAFLESRIDGERDGSDVRFLSLDLEQTNAARIKIYVARNTAADVETLLEGTRNSVRGMATDWLRVLTQSEGPFLARPILTCFAFDERKFEPTATVHVPIRCYSPHDEETFARIAKLMPASDAELLGRALEAVAGRPLRAASGIITYASLSKVDDLVRITTYLAPECYAAQRTNPSGTYRVRS